MEEISKMLKDIQIEMQQQKLEIREMKEDITNAINNKINERFRDLEERNELLEEKIKNQQQNFEYLSTRRNVLFFGVAEEEIHYSELESKILSLIINDMQITCGKSNIEFVRRIGKRGNKIRPVVVTFTTMGKKIEILRKKKTITDKSYYVKEDFPKEVLNKRKELQSQLIKERESGKYAILKYDKLIVREKKNTNTNKRHLSESPKRSEQNDRDNNVKKTTQIHKRNKFEMKKFVTQTPRNVTITHSETK